MVDVYLTRRNLLALLSKLDRNKTTPNSSHCTLIKQDVLHPKYTMTECVRVMAVEDEAYYTDREPGDVHPADLPNVVRGSNETH